MVIFNHGLVNKGLKMGFSTSFNHLVRERPFNLKGGGYGFFLKKYSDFGGGKKNLVQSFCHII
jgi:hypothetical protein